MVHHFFEIHTTLHRIRSSTTVKFISCVFVYCTEMDVTRYCITVFVETLESFVKKGHDRCTSSSTVYIVSLKAVYMLYLGLLESHLKKNYIINSGESTCLRMTGPGKEGFPKWNGL